MYRRPPTLCLIALLALAAGSGARADDPQPPAPKPAPKPILATQPVRLPAPPPWPVLQAAYAYPAEHGKPVVTEAVRDDPELLRIHIAFTDRKGEKVTGLFVRPKAFGVYPVVLVLHGLGGSKDEIVGSFGNALAHQGVACLALDARLHGERAVPKKNPGDGITFVGVLHGTVLDYRQALDYLVTRRDVDKKRIGLFGYSMGAMTGAILIGVDDRVQAAALCVGGDPLRPAAATAPPETRLTVELSAPANFIGHAEGRPVYLVNGSQDTTITPDAARRLQNAARNPKTIVWVKSGHLLPPAAIQKSLGWLLDRLGVAPPPFVPPSIAPSPSPAPAATP